MFVVFFFFKLLWVLVLVFFLFLDWYYNFSDMLAYKPVYLKVNKFSVCSLTTTPSTCRYTSFLYKELLRAKSIIVILFVHTVYIMPLLAIALQLLKNNAVPDPFTKALYCIALFAKVYAALSVVFSGLHLGPLCAFLHQI